MYIYSIDSGMFEILPAKLTAAAIQHILCNLSHSYNSLKIFLSVISSR